MLNYPNWYLLSPRSRLGCPPCELPVPLHHCRRRYWRPQGWRGPLYLPAGQGPGQDQGQVRPPHPYLTGGSAPLRALRQVRSLGQWGGGEQRGGGGEQCLHVASQQQGLVAQIATATPLVKPVSLWLLERRGLFVFYSWRLSSMTGKVLVWYRWSIAC